MAHPAAEGIWHLASLLSEASPWTQQLGEGTLDQSIPRLSPVIAC